MKKSKDPLEVLRNNIFVILKQRDWTAVHLAVLCEISYPTLLDILAGKRKNIWFSTVVKISEGTGVPISALIDEKREEDSRNMIFMNKIYSEIGMLLGKDNAAV